MEVYKKKPSWANLRTFSLPHQLKQKKLNNPKLWNWSNLFLKKGYVWEHGNVFGEPKKIVKIHKYECCNFKFIEAEFFTTKEFERLNKRVKNFLATYFAVSSTCENSTCEKPEEKLEEKPIETVETEENFSIKKNTTENNTEQSNIEPKSLTEVLDETIEKAIEREKAIEKAIEREKAIEKAIEPENKEIHIWPWIRKADMLDIESHLRNTKKHFLWARESFKNLKQQYPEINEKMYNKHLDELNELYSKLCLVDFKFDLKSPKSKYINKNK